MLICHLNAQSKPFNNKPLWNMLADQREMDSLV